MKNFNNGNPHDNKQFFLTYPLSVSIVGFVYLETAKWELACKTLGHALKVIPNI